MWEHVIATAIPKKKIKKLKQKKNRLKTRNKKEKGPERCVVTSWLEGNKKKNSSISSRSRGARSRNARFPPLAVCVLSRRTGRERERNRVRVSEKECGGARERGSYVEETIGLLIMFWYGY